MNTSWKYKINDTRWEIIQVKMSKFTVLVYDENESSIASGNWSIFGKYPTKLEAEFAMLNVEEIRTETRKQDGK